MNRNKQLALVMSAVVAVALGVFGGLRLADRLSQEPEESRPQASESINTAAKIAGSGAPLPTLSPEDYKLVVSETFDDGRQIRSEVDVDISGDYVAKVFYNDAGIVEVRFVNGIHYIKEADEWFEVTQDNAELFFVFEDTVFSQENIDAFNAIALQLADEPCGGALCSIWEVQTADDETVVIRVSNATRKIVDITGRAADSAFQASYVHVPVDISAPENAL